MSTREVGIVLAHAQQCERCMERLLSDPTSVFRGRALTDEEKLILTSLTPADFANIERLAEASGQAADDLTQYLDHPVARLRHF
jgi:hypothetical protein